MSAILTMMRTTSGLGGATSVVEVSGTAMNNIFDDVSFSEAASGDTEYRAIDYLNEGDSIAASVTVYMETVTSSPDTILNFGIEASHLNSTLSIANEAIAPVGVSFAHYTSGSELSLDAIPAGEYARVWLQRVVSVGAENTSEDLGVIAHVYA